MFTLKNVPYSLYILKRLRIAKITMDEPSTTNVIITVSDRMTSKYTSRHRSIIKPFLVALAIFGLYSPEWNHHRRVLKDHLKRMAVLLLHRCYCFGIVIFTWTLLGKSILLFIRDSRTSLIKRGFIVISSCQLAANASIFFLASMRERYKNLIDTFETMTIQRVNRLKKIAIALIVALSLAMTAIQSFIFLNIIDQDFFSAGTSESFTNHSNPFEAVTALGGDPFVTLNYINVVYSCFAFPTLVVFFSFCCYILSKQFKNINKNLKKMLMTLDVAPNDLNNMLLELRTEHGNMLLRSLGATSNVISIFFRFLLIFLNCLDKM